MGVSSRVGEKKLDRRPGRRGGGCDGSFFSRNGKDRCGGGRRQRTDRVAPSVDNRRMREPIQRWTSSHAYTKHSSRKLRRPWEPPTMLDRFEFIDRSKSILVRRWSHETDNFHPIKGHPIPPSSNQTFDEERDRQEMRWSIHRYLGKPCPHHQFRKPRYP